MWDRIKMFLARLRIIVAGAVGLVAGAAGPAFLPIPRGISGELFVIITLSVFGLVMVVLGGRRDLEPADDSSPPL